VGNKLSQLDNQEHPTFGLPPNHPLPPTPSPIKGEGGQERIEALSLHGRGLGEGEKLGCSSINLYQNSLSANKSLLTFHNLLLFDLSLLLRIPIACILTESSLPRL
jgi:hypothetical protein